MVQCKSNQRGKKEKNTENRKETLFTEMMAENFPGQTEYMKSQI